MASTTKRVIAAVISHYIETGKPATLGEVSRRSERTGERISPREVSRICMESGGNLIWTQKENSNDSVHGTHFALEPSEEIMRNVLRKAFMHCDTILPPPPSYSSVVVSPIMVVA